MEEEKLVHEFKALFGHLPDRELDLILELGKIKSYPARHIILDSGNNQRKIFLILQGAVRGYRVNPLGEEKTVLLRSKGIFIGDADCLFGGGEQTLTLETIPATAGIMFDFDSFEKLALSNENIMKLYLDSLKEAVLRLTYRVKSMITMNSEERYLDLLRLNPSFLKESYDKYIASYLGITPVSLSRIKKRLEKEKINFKQ